MLKKVLLVAVAAGLASAASLPLQIAPAQAAMTCKEAAKMKFPDMMKDLKERHAFKKECKDAWKASQK
jgi:catabolite regulation protein CreA